MKKTILLLTFAFAILEGFAQAENSNSVDVKGTENVIQKTLGNLIIQTIPSVVKIEIPKMGIDGNKTQDSLILEEIYTGKYDLAFTLKKKKFKCSVEVLNQKTIHVLVDVKKKKIETKEINYKPHLPDPIPVDTSEVYVIVDDMPEFPGGMNVCQRWINRNIKYPEEALQRKIQGLVFVTFIINREGMTDDIRIVRSVNPLFDNEAERIIKSMPTWKPGRQKGKLVKVSYTFPINFQLKDHIAVDTSAVCDIIDEMPEFPGGMNECHKWICRNIRYPIDALNRGATGKVLISCIINKKGKIENIKVLRSVDPVLDEEAIRVINTMPDWNPGRNNGELAKVAYTFPISFNISDNVPVDTSEVYVIVDEMPEFPGGSLELQKWIAMNVRYPVRAMQNGVTGRVYISCVVNENGDVENVKIVRSVSPSLDAESVRVISSMPKWKPGRLNGKLVKVSYTFPINFQME